MNSPLTQHIIRGSCSYSNENHLNKRHEITGFPAVLAKTFCKILSVVFPAFHLLTLNCQWPKAAQKVSNIFVTLKPKPN